MFSLIGLRAALSAAGAVFGKLSPKVWLALGCALALILGVLWHRHVAHDAISSAYAKGQADEAEHVKQQALAIKAKVDKLTSNISATLRSKNDEENRRIAGTAHDVLVRGPGKAVCPGSADTSSTPVRYVQAAPETGHAVDPVPDSGGQQLIALPFAPTVQLVKEHDQCLVDLQSVEEQHSQLLKVWPKGAATN